MVHSIFVFFFFGFELHVTVAKLEGNKPHMQLKCFLDMCKGNAYGHVK